jgi:hypothetical protein
MALTSKAVYKSNVNGLGPTTSVVTLSKVGISEADTAKAIKKAEVEGNSIAGIIAATDVVTILIQGAGITAGADYGATGVTSATTLTFS